MNKKIAICSILVLGVVLNVGCQKKDIKKVEEKPKQSVTETVETDKQKEQDIIKIESDKIDFSKIEYKSSETKRDEKIEKSIIDYLDYNKEKHGELSYLYNYVDLNGDNKEEIFVYLIGNYVSGSGGTTGLIMEKENYEVISNITLVRNPIIISEEKTNGWNNIIMSVSGGGIEPFYSKLEFDGEKYPSNPSTAPKVEEGAKVKGIAIISDDLSKKTGITIK